MNIDDQLSDAMLRLASDSPTESEVAASVRARMNRRHHRRRTVIATLAAVAAVAAILTTASLARSSTTSDEIHPASPAQLDASSSPLGAVQPTASSAPVQPSSAPVPASSAPVPATGPVPASSGAPIAASSPGPASSAPIAAGSAPVNGLATTVSNTAPTSSSGRCYATADIGRTDNYLAFSIGGGSEPVTAGSVALDICGQDWEKGTLSSSAPFILDQPAASAGRSTPGLVVCVLPPALSDVGTEEVAVFPGPTDTCSRLQLPKYTG